ncbi:hypothetical protein [Methylorubrum populi]|uniref:hypothetical protein n=1 Tax=Methylorubrum populi TaxID=223967 RepID=UPI000DB3064F|nr:hypothetical protein [Methylorubrum populi]PZP71770.1 MAG: hypothetical protein DI590_05780 [Methylorubrum populi]
MAADFTLNFRVGGTRASAAERDPKFIAARTVELLRKQAEAKGVERVAEAIVAAEAAIIQDITLDAQRFGASAARVFTRIKSPASGSVSIAFDTINRGAAVFSSDRTSSRLKGKTTTEWLALTKATIANKHRRMKASRRRTRGVRSAGDPNTFFVDTGDLRKTLTDFLGPAMGMLVDPKITVRRGPRKVTVSISLLAQASGKEKAGVSAQSLPGAYGGRATRSESLFLRYLKKAGAPDRDPKHPLAHKLENPRGISRPFLQDTLLYWISIRLPLVLEKSLRTALSRRTKKNR